MEIIANGRHGLTVQSRAELDPEHDTGLVPIPRQHLEDLRVKISILVQTKK